MGSNPTPRIILPVALSSRQVLGLLTIPWRKPWSLPLELSSSGKPPQPVSISYLKCVEVEPIFRNHYLIVCSRSSMVPRSRLRPLLLALGVLLLTLVPVSSLPVARACINPPTVCTTPDFELSMEAPDATVNQGNPPLALANIYGFSNAYFSGNVNLNLTISPENLNGPVLTLEDPVLSFIPAVFRGSGVLISAGLATPLGNYTVTVTGKGDNITHTTSFVLIVASPIPPDNFTIALYPIPTQFQPRGHSDVTIQVFRNGPPHMVPIDLTVELNLTITPSGLVATGFPGSVYIGTYDGIGTTFSVQSSSTTAPGVYTLNATGTNYQRSQSLSHSATVTINVAIPSPQKPPPNSSSGPSTPQPDSHPKASTHSTRLSTLKGALSILATMINKPIFWTFATGVGAFTILSLTAVAIVIRGNRRKQSRPSNWKDL